MLGLGHETNVLHLQSMYLWNQLLIKQEQKMLESLDLAYRFSVYHVQFTIPFSIQEVNTQ